MKTALVLSGGGSRGAYQIGVYQALLDMEVKLDMVVGTSIGAMNSYIIAQEKVPEAKLLWLSLNTEEVFKPNENNPLGFFASFDGIKDVLKKDFSEEACRKSPVDFGLCTVKLPDIEAAELLELLKDGLRRIHFKDLKAALNISPDILHLWKDDIPKGEMLDYILASCSCYPITKPYEIHREKYVDGGFADYIPVSMALEKGADRIIIVNLEAVGTIDYIDLLKANLKAETITISPSKKLGNMAEFSTENAKRIMHMGYIDTLREFKKQGLV